MAHQTRATPVSTVVFGGALIYAMALCAYTQFLLGVLAPLITEDLGLSRTQLGSLTTAIFVVGGLSAPLVGPLVDALGGRRMLALTFGVAGAAWIGMALAPSYGWLLATACVAGLVRGASNPVGNKLLALHSSEEHLGVLMGVSKSGAHVGGFLVGVIVPSVALMIGWRGVTGASAALAAVGLVGTFAIIPRDRSRHEIAEGDSGGAPARPLLRWLGPHAFLVGFGSGSVNAYLPLFAVERVGTTVARAGLVVSFLALTGIVGRIAWGRQASAFSTTSLPLVLIAGFGAAALSVFAAASDGDELLLWVGALAFGLTAGSWIAVSMLAIVREVSTTVAGKTSGVVLGLFYGGFACSPLLFGYLVDRTGSYAWSWLTGTAGFTGACLVALWHHRSQVDAVAAS